MPVVYKKNPAKIIEGLIWIANKKPGIDHYHIVKTLFIADKLHLNKYGRPIFGDTYVAMEYGPVPSFALDLINVNKQVLTPDQISEIRESLVVNQVDSIKYILSKRASNFNLFSGTDLKCLEQAFNLVEPLSFGELMELTHKEKAWDKAWHGKEEGKRSVQMEIEAFVDEDNEHKDELIRYIRETSPTLVL